MSYFVIEHKRHGVFVSVTPTPHFTWKHAATKGKHFSSKSEAQAMLDTFDDGHRSGCRVVEEQT